MMAVCTSFLADPLSMKGKMTPEEQSYFKHTVSNQAASDWLKEKKRSQLPLDLTAEASDCIQPDARIFVFLLLGNHKVSRAATRKVALASACNPLLLTIGTKCTAYFVAKA